MLLSAFDGMSLPGRGCPRYEIERPVRLVFRQFVEDRRRWKSALLLALLLFPLIALAATPMRVAEISLPACCRAHGKHHCSMDAEAIGASRTPAVSRISERCPFQGVSPAPHFSSDIGAPPIVSNSVAFTSNQRVELQHSLTILYKTAHVQPKRGPPDSSDCSHEV